jgi:hypothetical protein
MDVFREPHVGDRWVCRREASITLPCSGLILHTREGIPFATPEVALLFKAKHVRERTRLISNGCCRMDQVQRSRLIGWLSQVHPCHPWIKELVIDRS